MRPRPLWYSATLNLTCPKSGSTHNLSCLSWIILASGGFCCLLFVFLLNIVVPYYVVRKCKWTISQFLFVKQYKVVNYVLFLSDFPIGKKEKPIYNECPDGNMIFAKIEIWFCPDGNMILPRWKYDFAKIKIWFCPDGNMILPK